MAAPVSPEFTDCEERSEERCKERFKERRAERRYEVCERAGVLGEVSSWVGGG